MFCHQAVGMNSMPVFFKAFRDKKQEPASVLFVKKIYPGGVTPEDDMVTGTGILESWFSCHGSRIDSETPICQA